jgi:hypothetical protein
MADDPSTSPDPNPPSAGGSGGQPRNRHRLADLKIEERLLRHGVEIPEAYKKALLSRIAQILSDRNAHDRSILGAGKLLATLENTFASAVDAVIKVRNADDLAEEVEALRDDVDQLKSGGKTP